MEFISGTKSAMSSSMKRLALLLSFITLGLIGCGGGDTFSTGGTAVDSTVAVASRLIISTDLTTVQSDGSDSATISVLALDSSNAAVAGVVVDFSTTAGFMSASSAATDATGLATISFSAGIADPTNQTVTITATSGSATPVSIPVVVAGSSVSITATRDNLVIGGADTSTLTVTAVNSAGTGVNDVPVTISIDSTYSTGLATLSAPGGGTTDPQGQWSVDLTGTSPGTVRVVATALNATTYYDFLVENVAGSLLITSPVSGATTAINIAATVSIAVPASVTDITLVSSLGTWGSSGTSTATWSGLSGPVTVNDTLTSASVGTASINVADTNNAAVNDNILLYFVNQTVDANSVVSLQASPTSILPSTATDSSSTAIEANVYDASSTPNTNIAGARVTFTLSNTTGSGEYVYPPVAYTDAFGVARTTLYAGTQSTTGNGLTVTGSLDAIKTAPSVVTSSVSIIVGGTAGSISIGVGTKVATIGSTGYSLPISLQVSDANGSAMANTVVNLSLWPQSYALGFWACTPEPGIWRETILANEDIDRDLNLDLSPSSEDRSGDGYLTPANSSGGTVPTTVTTDANGIATFNLSYLKVNAGFVYDILTATTLVQGTETLATTRFWLPALESDVTGCYLGESPFTTSWPQLLAVADVASVAVGGTTNITVTLIDQFGAPYNLQSVSAEIISEGTFSAVNPTLSASPQTTDASGMATFTYTAGDQAGTDWIKVSYVYAGVSINSYVAIDAQ
jgi:hypothetical protein